jgi:hypothetical protein
VTVDDTRPPCPSCGGRLVIVRSVVRDNGRHRFMKCKACPPPNNRHRDLIAPPIAPVPAPGDPSCERCREWLGFEADHPCRFGFPEPVSEGPGFARDCAVFEVEG